MSFRHLGVFACEKAFVFLYSLPGFLRAAFAIVSYQQARDEESGLSIHWLGCQQSRVAVFFRSLRNFPLRQFSSSNIDLISSLLEQLLTAGHIHLFNSI